MNWKSGFLGLVAGASLVMSIIGPALAADIPITTRGIRWVSGANESNGEQPLQVNVKKGDVLVIQLPSSMIHGFVTINKKPFEAGTPAKDVMAKKDLVIACGQAESNSAVLQQTDCTAQPAKFGEASGGTLRLQVRDNFAGDVMFYCTEHFEMMWGIIHLTP